MIDIKKEKIDVQQLALGMYVTELDRPWINTPFMLQGFVLDDATELSQMRALCQFVYIDRTKSIGEHFAAVAKADVAVKREGAVASIKDPQSARQGKQAPARKTATGEKISFADLLREIKTGQSVQTADTGEASVIFNLRQQQTNGGDLPLSNKLATEALTRAPSKNILQALASLFIDRLFSANKPKSGTKTLPAEARQEAVLDDGYRIVIYEEDPPVEDEIAHIYPVYEQTQIATRDIFTAVANDKQLDITGVSEVLDSMVDSIERSPDALLWLAKLKQTDDYAYNHALNVSITLMALANFLAFSRKQINHLGLAGLLQDIGKIKLSADILLKEGKLTREEFEYAKIHTIESLKILKNNQDIAPEVIKLVAEHHERIDGSGYPKQLKENELSLASQITGLIDTYCAITSNRVYAKGLYHQKALEEINGLAGKQFSQDLIDQFVQFMGIYPVSSLVELNTGEVAVVIQQNQVRRLLPRLMLILDQNKERYLSPIFINLLLRPKSPDGALYAIVKSLQPDSYGLNPSDFYL